MRRGKEGRAWSPPVVLDADTVGLPDIDLTRYGRLLNMSLSVAWTDANAAVLQCNTDSLKICLVSGDDRFLPDER